MPERALPTNGSLPHARPGRVPKQGRRARLALLLVILMLATTHSAPGSWNDQSRIATVQSLVESGSFIIDNSIFKSTGDKVLINGHFYSDKPPILSVLGAAVYLPLYHLGFVLQRDSSVPYYLVTLLTVKLFWLLGSIAFFHALRFTGLEARKCFLASIALALGSLYFSWSATFNSHELAASFLSIGFYFVLKARFSTNVNLSLSGAAFFSPSQAPPIRRRACSMRYFCSMYGATRACAAASSFICCRSS